MMKRVEIINADLLGKYKNIDDYLLHTYGEEKLNHSRRNSSPTFLDVIGYTLEDEIVDGFSYETMEGKHYELYEIEQMMKYSE